MRRYGAAAFVAVLELLAFAAASFCYVMNLRSAGHCFALPLPRTTRKAKGLICNILVRKTIWQTASDSSGFFFFSSHVGIE